MSTARERLNGLPLSSDSECANESNNAGLPRFVGVLRCCQCPQPRTSFPVQSSHVDSSLLLEFSFFTDKNMKKRSTSKDRSSRQQHEGEEQPEQPKKSPPIRPPSRTLKTTLNTMRHAYNLSQSQGEKKTCALAAAETAASTSSREDFGMVEITL